MKEQKAKWPESLPPPLEMVEGPVEVRLTPQDLKEASRIADLVHDLYWFPDAEYFIYFPYGQGIGIELSVGLEAHGIEIKKTEMYFYRYPNGASENEFIRVLPHSDVSKWQRQAAQCQMFGRTSLCLETATRKQMDFREAARVANDTISNDQPIIEAKPNFFGMGLNLNGLWRKAQGWWRRRKKV